MSIRMTGMMSGMDTDSIIKELMSAQSMKKTKIEGKKTKLEWTMDKWKGLNSKIYGLYTGNLNKVKTASNYQAKKVTSSNEGIIIATGNSTAASGSHTIKVDNLASSQHVTGKQLTSHATGGTKLKDMGFSSGETIEVTVGSGSEAKTKTLTVGDSTTINDFVNTLKSAGLTASFDETQQRFFISSEKSGADNKFLIKTMSEAGNMQTAKEDLLTAVGTENASLLNDFYNNYSDAIKTLDEKKANYDTIFDSSSTATDEERLKAYEEWTAAKEAVKNLEDNLKSSVRENLEADITKDAQDQVASDYADKIKNDPAIADIYNSIVKEVDKMYYKYDADGNKISPAEFTDEALAAADTSIQTKKREEAAKFVNDAILAGAVYDSEEAKQQAIQSKYEELYNAEIGSTDASKKAALEAEAAVMYNNSVEGAIQSAGRGYLDTTEGADKVAALVEGKKSEIDAKINGITSAVTAFGVAVRAGGASTTTYSLENLGLSNITLDATGAVTIGGPGHPSIIEFVAAEDAKITFDGAELTSKSNDFTAAGINFQLKGKSSDTISLNVSNDITGTYDMVKNFVKSYNEILTEMSTAFYATSSKGYDPLTTDQKKAMSDDEIEQWNKKIQDSLLRRDDTLGSLMETMRTALQGSVTVDGKKYSLASFGITTSDDWTERGLLHILGDKDDTYLPGDSNNKLQKALEADPELVGKVISGITNNLYETLQSKMSTSTLSSALTFYNDKQMTKQVDSYKKDIKTWEEKLQDMEDRYYKQFSAMETALAKLNSQSSALSGLMGS